MPRKPVVTVPIRPKMVTTVSRTTVLAWRRRLSASRYWFISPMRSLTSVYSGSSPRWLEHMRNRARTWACSDTSWNQYRCVKRRKLAKLSRMVRLKRRTLAASAMSRFFRASASRSENISSAAFWKCAIRNSKKCWCRNCASTPRSRQTKNGLLASPSTSSEWPLHRYRVCGAAPLLLQKRS